jgi:RNA polymerase sigma-70 factor (ECF subfamily)
VAADDQVSSSLVCDQTTQTGAAAFATTHWSIVLGAQEESPAAAAALETLCRTYWKPLYAFVRRKGFGREEARDLTQGFFALLLERRDLEPVRKEKGRFRSYLLTAFKNFLTDEWRRSMAIKRGEGRRPLPLDEMQHEESFEIEDVDAKTPELIYERHWAATLLEKVLGRLRTEYEGTGRLATFDALKELLANDPDAPSHDEIGRRLGMKTNAVRQAFHRFRQRYQFLLREEIAQTVASPGEVEDELRHLISVIRA